MYRLYRSAVRALLLLTLLLGAALPLAAQAPDCTAEVDYAARAEAALAEGQYDAAADAYTCIIETDPDAYSAYLGRASAAILAAAVRGELDFNVNSDLGVVYDEAYSTLTDAITAYSDDIAADPTDIEARAVRGYIYWYTGQNQNAVADFDAIVRQDANNAYAVLFRGAANQYAGNDAKAAADFDRAIQISTDPAGANAQVGAMYVNTGDIERGIEYYTEAITLDPANADYYNYRAFAYGDLGNNEAAVADFTRAIELEPDNIDHFLNRAWKYEQLDDYTAAAADYARAIELDPTYPVAYEYRGWALIELGEFVEAVEMFDQSLALDTAARWSYLGRGTAHAGAGSTALSALDFEQYIALTESYRTDAETMKPGRSQTLEVAEGQVYVVPVNAEAGTSIEIQATAQTDTLDPMILLLGVNGVPLAGSDDISNGNLNAAVAIQSMPDSGRYTLLVTHAGGGSFGTLDIDIIQTGASVVTVPTVTPPTTDVCATVTDFAATAHTFAVSGQFDAALETVECGLAEAPDDPTLLLQRGLVALVSGPTFAAFDDINLADDLDVELVPSQIDALAEVVAQDPNNLYALTSRAYLNWMLANDEAAQPDYAAILAQDPDNVVALLFRGSSGQYLGDVDAAAADFERAAQLSNNEPAVLQVIMYSLYDTNENERALEYLDTLITLDPNNTTYLATRAQALRELGRIDEAIADLNVALGIAPDNVGLLEDLGWIYLETGQAQMAAASFGQSLELDDTRIYATLGLATARNLMNDPVAAAQGYADFIEYFEGRSLTANLVNGEATLSITESDVYRLPLALTAGQTININVNWVEGDVDPLALLLDPTGAPLVGNDDADVAGNYDSQIAGFVAPQTGTYTLVVTHAGAGSTGTLDVVVTGLSATPTLPPKGS